MRQVHESIDSLGHSETVQKQSAGTVYGFVRRIQTSQRGTAMRPSSSATFHRSG